MTIRRHHVEPTLVAFDVETSGTDPQRHEVIQYAFRAYHARTWKEVAKLEGKVLFDEAAASPEAIQKNHYDKAVWAQHAVQSLTAYQRICYFLREHATVENYSERTGKTYFRAQLLAHNSNFDRDFLFAWSDRLKEQYPQENLFLPAEWHVICTYQKALDFFQQNPCLPRAQNFQLGTLCNYFGIPFSVNESHDALYDTEATMALYYTMTAAPQIHVKAA